MIDTKKIEQLARQVQDAMPQGIRNLGDDVEKKFVRYCRLSWVVWI